MTLSIWKHDFGFKFREAAYTAQGIFSYGISVIRMNDYSSLELISCTNGEKKS